MRAYLKLIHIYLLFFSSVAIFGQAAPTQLHQDDGLWAYFSGLDLLGINESPFRLPETDVQLKGITGAPGRDGLSNSAFYFNHPDNVMVMTKAVRAPHQSVAFHFKSDGVTPGTLCGYEAGGFLISMAENGKLDVRLEVSPLAAYHYQSTRNFDDGAWHHLVVSFGKDGLRVWLDGQKSFQDNRFASSPQIHFRSEDLYFGTMSDETTYFNGRMQDIMLYNRALRPAEVKILSAGSRPRFLKRLERGEVFRAGFNANQVNNEANVAVPRTAGNYSFSGFLPGRTGSLGDGAAKLNGLGDHISVAGTISLGKHSVAMWFNTVSSQAGRLLEIDGGNVFLDLNIGTPSGQLTLGKRTASSVIVESSSLADGGWHHFLLSADTDEGIRLYLDGKEVAQMPPNNDEPAGLDIIFGGGKGKDARFFDGLLDDLVVYNRALTPTEVKALFKASPYPTPKQTKLFDCFPDRSGKALLLVMGNMGSKESKADVKENNGTSLIKKWQLQTGELAVQTISAKCGCSSVNAVWR